MRVFKKILRIIEFLFIAGMLGAGFQLIANLLFGTFEDQIANSLMTIFCDIAAYCCSYKYVFKRNKPKEPRGENISPETITTGDKETLEPSHPKEKSEVSCWGKMLLIAVAIIATIGIIVYLIFGNGSVTNSADDASGDNVYVSYEGSYSYEASKLNIHINKMYYSGNSLIIKLSVTNGYSLDIEGFGIGDFYIQTDDGILVDHIDLAEFDDQHIPSASSKSYEVKLYSGDFTKGMNLDQDIYYGYKVTKKILS